MQQPSKTTHAQYVPEYHIPQRPATITPADFEFKDQPPAVREILQCLAMSYPTRKIPNINLPNESVRNENYQHLIEFTAKWRPVPLKTHTYKGYSGPWLEHYFYQHFCCDRPLSDFGPLIPIFVPWLDIEALQRRNYVTSIRSIFSQMRSDCLYVTVCQSGQGVEALLGIEQLPPNLLVLSAAGRGNVPIVYHIKPNQPIRHFTDEISSSFVGDTSVTRKPFIDSLKSTIPDFASYKGPDWHRFIVRSRLNICPRGVNPSSFRFFEMIEMGAVPVYMWTDRFWLPYWGALDYAPFSFIFNNNQSQQLFQLIRTFTHEQAVEMRKNVMKVRDDYFTVEGNMKQIGLFLKNGFSGSNLRCAVHLKEIKKV